MTEMVNELKHQGVAAMVLVTLAILTVLGIVILGIFQSSIQSIEAIGRINASDTVTTINETISLVLPAFIAGLVLFGTFATVTALIIVVKAMIGIVKGMSKKE